MCGVMIEPWTQTFTGKRFDTFDPKPHQFCIEDIAMSLSRICRFNGHSLFHYSVAQHCVLMARAVSPANAFAALMHDVSESYLPDMPGPVKRHFPNFVLAENLIMERAAAKFGFEWPLPDEVIAADRRILIDERDQVMRKPSPSDWGLEGKPLGVDIKYMPAPEARAEFLSSYDVLKNLME